MKYIKYLLLLSILSYSILALTIGEENLFKAIEEKNSQNVSSILSGDTNNEGDYIRYYNYTPKAENTVKVFMWSGMSPLCTASTVVPMDKN